MTRNQGLASACLHGCVQARGDGDRLEGELPKWLDLVFKKERLAELLKEHDQRLSEPALALGYQKQQDELDHIYRKHERKAGGVKRSV